uniref:Uncharacterized protein n=1 Tax=Anopheles maculatus TaxID=74869 RepID=A0A182SS66_9DIPT
MNVVLWLNIGSGALQAPFYNQTIDICSLIKNPGTHRLVLIVYRELRRHGNMPTGCPIASTLYKFRDISTSQMRLPAFFTQTDFMVDIIVISDAWTESMAQYQICMLVALCVCWAIIVCTDSTLYPIITHKEIYGNEAYLNASIEDVGEYDFNRTYLIQFEAFREIRELKHLFTYSVRALHGAIENALLSRWVDGCEFLRRPNSNRLLKLFYDTVKNNSKIDRCPYAKGDTVMMNITPSNFHVPSILPESDFLIEVKSYMRALKVLVMKGRTALMLLLAHLLLVETAQKLKLVVILTSVEVTTNTPYLNSTVTLKRYNVAPYASFNMSIITMEKFNTLTLQSSYYVRSGTLDNLLYESKIDLCTFFQRKNERLVKMIYDNLKRHGQVPQGCPVEPTTLTFTNITLNYVNLPVYLPESNFKLMVKCWQGHERILIFDSRWYGRLKKVRINK